MVSVRKVRLDSWLFSDGYILSFETMHKKGRPLGLPFLCVKYFLLLINAPLIDFTCQEKHNTFHAEAQVIFIKCEITIKLLLYAVIELQLLMKELDALFLLHLSDEQDAVFFHNYVAIEPLHHHFLL